MWNVVPKVRYLHMLQPPLSTCVRVNGTPSQQKWSKVLINCRSHLTERSYSQVSNRLLFHNASSTGWPEPSPAGICHGGDVSLVNERRPLSDMAGLSPTSQQQSRGRPAPNTKVARQQCQKKGELYYVSRHPHSGKKCATQTTVHRRS